MNPENAIEVNSITKNFKVYYDKGSTIKEKVVSSRRRKYEHRQVLKGISFDVKKGEAIGIIGHNGCGKSTTLKLLTKIMYPDSGSIEIQGRVSSLIELGAGFHPDMSGRENIYINAAIFGLSKKEIDYKLDDIIMFSELEEYIDNPVRTYSSGMYMRLAFSVAINVDADVLLIDEILAVGDTNFQSKCFNRLREVKKQGTTIVIVSHSLAQIEEVCERSIWINDGVIAMEGLPRDVHPQYLIYMVNKQQEIVTRESIEKSKKKSKDKLKSSHLLVLDNVEISEDTIKEDTIIEDEILNDRQKSLKEQNFVKENIWAKITKVRLMNEDNEYKDVFKTGDTIIVQLDYEINKPINNAVFGFGIFRNDGMRCYGTNTKVDKYDEFDLIENGTIKLILYDVNLLPGEYELDIAIQSEKIGVLAHLRDAYKILIFADKKENGIIRINHEWKLNN